MSKQVLHSGTAIGALVREAEHAQSKADFINKMSIALKEATVVAHHIGKGFPVVAASFAPAFQPCEVDGYYADLLGLEETSYFETGLRCGCEHT